MKEFKKSKWILGLGIVGILFFIGLRLVGYYYKSDGFSGISVLLPLFMAGILIFALLTSVCFSAWVYQDCKKRMDDGILWAAIVFIATPFIGLLVYFLRREEIKRICQACGNRISIQAKYCPECGSLVDHKEDIKIMEQLHTHHYKYIIAGIISILFLFISLGGFIVSASVPGNINTSITSEGKVWNTGVVVMSSETHFNGVWKLSFKRASEGYIAQERMKLENAAEEVLYADLSCTKASDDSTLVLWLVQGETSRSVDVTDLTEPIEIPLTDFEAGKIQVRLQCNGVTDVSSEIKIQPKN